MLAVEVLVATEWEMFSIKDLNSYSIITTAIWEPDASRTALDFGVKQRENIKETPFPKTKLSTDLQLWLAEE